ncbi:MAG: transcription antitermination factor NusB [Clostridium sp.]|nr:transcription antitermination factor NusB [Clostridium sp.]
MKTRRQLREHCYKLLFCTGFHSEEEIPEQIDNYFGEPKEKDETPEGDGEVLHNPEMDSDSRIYVTEKVQKILAVVPELDEKINGIAKGWKTTRMGKEELTILRLALYEILYEEDTPEKVSINEAVELAKKYGGDDSPKFVNGILAKLV